MTMSDYEVTRPLTRRQDRPGYAARMKATREQQELDYLAQRLSRWAGTGKPELAQDRAIFISVLERAARNGDYTVNANLIRETLTGNDGEFVISPQSYSSMFNSLVSFGVLEVIGKVKNTDAVAGNAGKSINNYRFHETLRG
jgi:hypothetical protein